MTSLSTMCSSYSGMCLYEYNLKKIKTCEFSLLIRYSELLLKRYKSVGIIVRLILKFKGHLLFEHGSY